MKSLAEQLRNKYITENLECSTIVNYDKADISKTYLYKDLPDLSINGYPFAADFISDKGVAYGMQDWLSVSEEEKKRCTLRFHYLPCCHEIYLGCTGSGKTTGCIEPQLRALSSQKNKPDLFITDPKGELFDHNARHLKDNGYRLYVLNFKNLTRSDNWNPLLELYDTAMKLRDIGKGTRTVTGALPEEGLTLFAPIERFNKALGYIVYDGKAFPSPVEYDVYIEVQENSIHAEIDQLVNEIAHTMIQVTNKNDKTWEEGAIEMLKGLFILMVDFAVEGKGFTREMMNMQTLHSYYITLRTYSMSGGERTGRLDRYPLFCNGKHKKAFDLLATALNTAQVTMRGYCSIFEAAMQDWFQANIYAITTSQTVNLDKDDDTPFAIFLITRDYEKSDFRIAGLFIDWVYRFVLKRNEDNPDSRPVHFLLDEFGNIPKIADFENKIATARSRNMWFHLVLQSYAQLDLIYEKASEIIVDNCNSLVFLGSQNAETKKKFSEQCGLHSIERYLLQESTAVDIIEVPIVPRSRLDEMRPGEMYIKRFSAPVIKSEFIRSYICAQEGYFPHFRESDGLETCTPFASVSYANKRFIHSLPKVHDDD